MAGINDSFKQIIDDFVRKSDKNTNIPIYAKIIYEDDEEPSIELFTDYYFYDLGLHSVKNNDHLQNALKDAFTNESKYLTEQLIKNNANIQTIISDIEAKIPQPSALPVSKKTSYLPNFSNFLGRKGGKYTRKNNKSASKKSRSNRK